MLSIIKRRLL